MEDSTVQSLLKIGSNRRFAPNEYVCHEGMPGDEMYVVISGHVASYISNMNDDEVLSDEKYPGEIFGEISLLDRKPRSATYVAMEDTLCIAIHQDRLREMLAACPEISEIMLRDMASRLRSLNEKVYKMETPSQDARIQPFSIAKGFREHDNLPERWAPAKYLIAAANPCPVCGHENTMYHLRMNSVTCTEVLPSQRHIYQGFDILWHYVWQCAECGYANFYMNFFQMPKVNRAMILRLISMQNSYLENIHPRYACDRLVIAYYRAIHFNESFNSSNATLVAKLWRYLCWLYTDMDDLEMANYCRDKALFAYRYLYKKSQSTLQTESARQQCAMILAELYLEKGDFSKAKPFYNEVTHYPGRILARKALDRLQQLLD